MQRIKHFLLSTVILTVAAPTLAFADVSVTNTSSAFYTANMDLSPCSSIIGDKGIMKPHSALSIPKAVIDLYCGIKPCEAQVYLSKNCSGKKIAKVTIAKDKGVTNIENYDSDYVITGLGNTVTISGKSSGWLDWLLG